MLTFNSVGELNDDNVSVFGNMHLVLRMMDWYLGKGFLLYIG